MATLQIATAPVFQPLLRHARYKGAHGGRGSGKSHFFAEALVEKAVTHPGETAIKVNGKTIPGPGLRWVCIREVQRDLEQSAKRVVEDKIYSLGLGSLFNVQRDRIITPNDGLIIFRGMQEYTKDSIKSLEGYDGAWVEEASSLSQGSLDMLTPTIRKDYADGTSSELWFSWNPKHPTDPVDYFLRKAKPDDAIVVEANWRDNPWFPKVLRKEKDWAFGRDKDKYAHIWLGAYEKRSGAVVFTNWKVEEFETPSDARFYYGGDWGFSNDPTVLIRAWGQDRKLFIDHEAFQVGCELDYTPALFAGDDKQTPPRWSNPYKHEGVPDVLRWEIVADSARPETIAYMKRRGFRIRSALKGKGSVEDGIEFLKSYDIIVHPRCVHTIDELSTYSWKVDNHMSPPAILPILEDKNNHVIDALRYAVEGLTRRGVSMVDYL